MTDNRVARHAGAMGSPAGTAVFGIATGTAVFGIATGTAALGTKTGAAVFATKIRTASLVSAFVMTGLLLAGCSHNPEAGAAGSKLRVYATDLSGAAKSCDVPKVNPLAGGGTEAPMKMMNDGGWCAIRVHQDGPKPFDAGLLTTRPNHGDVVIHEVGDDTRIDYTPDRGFAGTDSFVVKLVPGDATIRVGVTVAPPKT